MVTDKEPTDPDTTKPAATGQARNSIIQVASIAGVIACAIFDLRTPDEAVPAIVYGTLLGLALGIDPMAFWKGFGK